MCEKCIDGYLVNEEGTCVKQICKEIFCLKCQVDETSTGNLELCTHCEYPYYVIEGKCELSCPAKYYNEEPIRKCVPKMSRDVNE